MLEFLSIVDMPPGTAPDANQREVLYREVERNAALVSGDVERLGALIADDLVHIHGNGKVEGKAEYLESIRTKYRFHSVNRSGVKIRIYGSVAVLTGTILQTFSTVDDDSQVEVEGLLTQTWFQEEAAWRQNTYHMQFLTIDGKPIA